MERLRVHALLLGVVALVGGLLIEPVWAAPASAAAPYRVGRGIADITGPPVGIKMLGYVRPDQITEGIHLRQWSRAFVIANPTGGRPVAIVTTDLQSVTHSLVLSVLDKLKAELGDVYGVDNVIIAATHTHAVPGGYWHYTSDTPLGAPFNPEHFNEVVAGIAKSIAAAHRDLAPGRILYASGPAAGAGAQRSKTAYLQNPAEERARYSDDTDTQIMLLRFERDGHPIGVLTWHAVHPTSMSCYNKLISSDNKGYAEYAFEQHERNNAQVSQPFVAAFAQSNCGDVTPNLSLMQHGPGKDEFDSTRIIGERMYLAALKLFESASEELSGPVDFRQSYVDFAALQVGDAYTHAGEQTTAPGAYGYSFGAGSTEDGGGQTMFREGMLKPEALIELIARNLLPLPPPNEALRKRHLPKPILLAVGASEPPAMPHVLPVSVFRIGQFAVVAGPSEYTTMSGRRFREAVLKNLPAVKHVAVGGYANDYTAYVATREEYEVQHYEGASTLYGPWTQAGYQQEFARLAADLAAGRASTSHEPPVDVRGKFRPIPLGTKFDDLPSGSKPGEVVTDAAEKVVPGQTVSASFVSGNPQNGYRAARQWACVEREVDGKWQPVAVDGEWDLKVRWLKQPSKQDPTVKPLVCTVEWQVPSDTAAGQYRLTHTGVFKPAETGKVQDLTGHSRTFVVQSK